MLNLSNFKHPPVGVMWKLGERRDIYRARVSSSPLNHGSILQSPSPKALEKLNSEMLIFTHSLTPLRGESSMALGLRPKTR
ncbi:hypothetical protein TNCV_2675601 [Trichonephila clavipes]|nr:hypothetical protein TNCV_2675601 [Trichonephila clavipes]